MKSNKCELMVLERSIGFKYYLSISRHSIIVRATPMGVAIRDAIPIIAKMAPQRQKLCFNGGDIRGVKMPSRVLGCHNWQLWRENREVTK